MNGVVRPPVFQLLKLPSGVFDDLAIDELDLTACRQERDQAWNTVHEQARIALAFAQCFIGYGELAGALRDTFLEFVGDAKQRLQRGEDDSRRLAARPWAGSAMMPRRSFRESRSRVTSSAGDSSGGSTSALPCVVDASSVSAQGSASPCVCRLRLFLLDSHRDRRVAARP